MIRLEIEVDDHPAWAECTKEAVAELLDPLGSVRVVKVTVDKPQQTSLFPPPQKPTPPRSMHICPTCGSTRVITVRGPEGAAVLRDIVPRPCWEDPHGPVWWMDTMDRWRRGRLEGDPNEAHTIGWPIHRCDQDREE